jgi:hypothetical protein
MTETFGNRPETELDRLRRDAFAKEARVLREAALQHFKEETSAELTGLKSALAAEMKAAVRVALDDKAVKEALRKELTDQLLGKVSADVAAKLGSQLADEVEKAEERILGIVRKEFLGAWTKAARKALEDGLKNARAELAPDQGGSSSGSGNSILSILGMNRTPKGDRGKEIEGEEGSKPEHVKVQVSAAENDSDRRDQNREPKKPIERDLDRNQGREQEKQSKFAQWRQDAVPASIILMIGAIILYFIFSNLSDAVKSIGGREDSLHSDFLEVTSEAYEESTTSPEEASDIIDEMLSEWGPIMDAAESGLPRDSHIRPLLRSHQLNVQFSCWFRKDVREKLEELARLQPPNNFKDQLESAFRTCFSRKPELRNKDLAIFSAQATVKRVLVRHQGDWESWCANGSEVRAAAVLDVDGLPGPSTSSNMNRFLTCTGHSAELRIDDNSEAPEYLYITYLALRDLRPS